MDRQDETLQGNEKIEAAIQALTKGSDSGAACTYADCDSKTYEGLRAGNRSG